MEDLFGLNIDYYIPNRFSYTRAGANAGLSGSSVYVTDNLTGLFYRF
jgi:hypothetical protein